MIGVDRPFVRCLLYIMEQELWKSIVGYEHYQVNIYGTVRRLPVKRPGTFTRQIYYLKPDISYNGYLKVNLRYNGKGRKFSIHRLIATYFIPNPENKKTVNHINGIRTDNRIENLEWATHSENVKHGFDKNGRISTLRKRVINTKTGESYDSLTIASLASGIKLATLSKQIIEGRGIYVYDNELGL